MIKTEYAAATGADLVRLLRDRAYKKQHRSALTSFFQDQFRQRPQLPDEHFLDVVHGATDVDVLLITGMRDEAPVAAFSHLVPDSRLLEVRVQANIETRRTRRGCQDGDDKMNPIDDGRWESNPTSLNWRPTFTFNNEKAGN